MAQKLRIEEAGADRVDDLRPLFLALHQHHRAVVVGMPLVDDDAAWRARREVYLARLDTGRARLLIATDGSQLAGYALVVFNDGADDTFPLAEGYAELYSLSVSAWARNAGLGGLLLDAVDRLVAEAGGPPLQIAVMADNVDALRFYRRRGLVPGEVLLYRFPDEVGPRPEAGAGLPAT